MEVSARDIQEQQFHDAWRGYNQEEVDDFLDDLAGTIERLTRENDALRNRVRELEETAHSSRSTEEMLKKTLLNAQQTADQSIAEAKAQAEKIISEAREKIQATDHDIEGRVAGAEEEVRRQLDQINHRYRSRKSELDESLVRLESFENAIKKRLQVFLEQQLTALSTLSEKQQRPIVDEPEFPVTQAPVQQQAPVEASASPEAPAEEDVRPQDVAEQIQVVQEEASEDGTVYELDSEESTVFDSLPRPDEDAASLDDFRPFDDDAAAVEGRRKRRLFKKRVDDWA
ncbi:MAG TPA: DivIVA domain-containing protein [Actinomycetota bacterium]|nr:DivIVA domain-containing protein [Actinomycetota bacterium]